MTLTSFLMKFIALAVVATSTVSVSTLVVDTPKVEQPVAPVAINISSVATSTPKKISYKKPISVGSEDCSKYENIINKYDWSTSTAMQICRDESRGNPEAINWSDSHYNSKGGLICSSSRGLMQIACMHPERFGYTLEDLIDPEKNIAIAYKIYLESGFSPWSTYRP